MFSATVRTTCTVLSPAGARRARALEALAGHLAPAPREVVVHVGHRGSAQPRADVVPAQAPPGLVRARVEAVAGVVGEVDAVDEGQLSVDGDRLLVVAVEGVLARVHLAADARAARERPHGLADLRATRVEGRHGRPGPHEDAHVDALGQLGQQRPGDDRRLALDELEVRREVPTGDVDEVARVLHGLGDLRQRVRAVDEDLERAALARRRVAGRPQAVVGRLERPLPAQAPQAAAVLGRHGGLDRVPDGGVGVADEGYRHG